MIFLFFLMTVAKADEWESKVNGQQTFDQIQSLLNYKKAQASEVENIFRGIRDKLYVIQPSSKTAYNIIDLTIHGRCQCQL